MSASIYMFITLIVSTVRLDILTLGECWWTQPLVKTFVCLSTPGIFYSFYHENFSVHSSNVFLFTRLPEWAVGFCPLSKCTICYFIYRIKYQYCQSSNCSAHYSKLILLFTLLLMWCSTAFFFLRMSTRPFQL